jgi:hypothetical protein
MVTITRSVVLLSAVVAGALVVAFETTGPRAETSSAAAQVAQRFPFTSEIFTPVPITYFVAQKFTDAQKAIAAQKAHQPPISELCSYLSRKCVVAAGSLTFMRS